jgi:hypothetical protein
MPAISAENKQYYKAKIRSILAFDQGISQRELRERLESQGITLDRGYLARLLDDIRVERTKRVETLTLNAALGGFADVMSEIVARAQAIADDPMSERGEVLAALREIRAAHNDVFQKLFDAGIFERKLGTIDATIRNTPLPIDKKQTIRDVFTNWGLLFRLEGRGRGMAEAEHRFVERRPHPRAEPRAEGARLAPSPAPAETGGH